MHIISCSGGNDSVALIQWAIERKLKDVYCVYSNTKWSVDWWPKRMEKVKKYCERNNIRYIEVDSEGMESLVRRKKGWPQCRRMQFCTAELKVIPFLELADRIDPEFEAICMVGVRREESKERSDYPEYIEESERHGGRSLWAPLVNLRESQRDELLERAGFDVLPHRSLECFPCVCSNKGDIKRLTPERIEYIAELEIAMGHTKNGKLRTIFRPKRHLGAIGIKEVYKWATRDEVDETQMELLGCTSGFCGD